MDRTKEIRTWARVEGTSVTIVGQVFESLLLVAQGTERKNVEIRTWVQCVMLPR